MADLDDLGYLSVTDKSVDENLEDLRKIRLSRRTPVKKTTSRKPAKKKDKSEEVSPEQAARLLKILTGE